MCAPWIVICRYQSNIHFLQYIPKRNKYNQLWSPPTSVIIYKRKSLDYLKTKAKEAYSWYENFTGLYEVRQAQHNVLEATQMLRESQEKRREARTPLNDVQKRLQNFLPELRNTPRGTDRYLELLKEEHECVKEVQYLQAQLQQAESYEREAFELLSSSLRTSHETERAQAERTKYWSLIASILGTIIGVAGSTLNNNYKMREFKNVILETNRVMYIDELMNNLEEFSAKYSVKEDLEKIYTAIQSQNIHTEPAPVVQEVVNNEQNIYVRSMEEERAKTRWLLLGAFGLGYVMFKIFS